LKLSESGFVSVLQSLLSKINLEIVNFNDPESKKINAKINEIRKETALSMSNTAAQELFMAVRATRKIEGDIAEVGVFRGGSAKVICEGKEDRTLHLFDTFKGLPRPGIFDDPDAAKEGSFNFDMDSVKACLMEFPNVHIYEGLFPDTAGPVNNTKFSLVHFDVGLYKSTFDCLSFFYPRMNRGGAIISHDYIYRSGVKKAFDEFFHDKLEIVLGLPSYQCIMIKL
jgi:O-methyltransferase